MTQWQSCITLAVASMSRSKRASHRLQLFVLAWRLCVRLFVRMNSRAHEPPLAPELIEDFLLEAQSRAGHGTSGWPPDRDGDAWPDGGEGGGEWDERGRWYPDAGEPGTPGEARRIPSSDGSQNPDTRVNTSTPLACSKRSCSEPEIML